MEENTVVPEVVMELNAIYVETVFQKEKFLSKQKNLRIKKLEDISCKAVVCHF